MTAARRLIVPSLIQTSAMDCGPASLKALLDGFGGNLDYGRLREACQTDIDGTSIDMLEQLTVKLGYDAAQFIVPVDHLLMDETEVLPAIVVIRHPNGLTHFVVVWRTHGRIVQVMDPGVGRLWRTRRNFLRDVFVHQFPVPPDLARSWLTIEGFLAPLRRRMADLGWTERAIEAALTTAQADEAWLPVAALDAATRLAARLVAVKAVTRGTAAVQLTQRLAADAASKTPEEALAAIPEAYWSVIEKRGEVMLVGAVLLHVAGFSEPPGEEEGADEEGADEEGADDTKLTAEKGRDGAPGSDATDDAAPAAEPGATDDAAYGATDAAPAAEPGTTDDAAPGDAASGAAAPANAWAEGFAAAARRSPVQALLAAMLTETGAVLPLVVLAMLIGGAVVAIEALLLGGLAGGTRTDAGAVALVLVFLIISTLLNVSKSAVLLRFGRWLDIHLRMRFLEKLPKLGNYYFHSRLPSDLAHRAYMLRSLRHMPQLAANGLMVVAEVLLTVAGIVWLFPSGALPVVLAALVLLGLPVATMPLMREQGLRVQTHAGALMRFYLDALIGLTPIRAHRAEQAVRAEHEALVTHWSGAMREAFWTNIGGLGVGMLAGTLFAVWAIGRHIDEGGAGTTLLVVYWTLKLPTLALSLAQVVQQVPMLDNTVQRLYEVLDASEEAGPDAAGAATATRTGGVRVELRGVGVVAAGQQILAEVDLDLAPGEHVAIVGPSGSGKSSLVGLLLGWHHPAAGTLTIDGEPLAAESLKRLRQETAWVDPGIQIWNRSLARNLRYGNGAVDDEALRAAITAADLDGVVERLPEGVDTALGEGGGLVSGGEGQRVRLARALLKKDARLAILDEPFRGLDGDKRRALLASARARWQGTTLVYVSHDIDTALGFSRVLVIEGGRIVEDGAPDALMADAGSRLAGLYAAQEALHREVWGDPVWRRWRMDRGVLRVPGEEAP